MSDALILEHLLATGGNFKEMAEHMSDADIERGYEIARILANNGVNLYS